MEMKYGIDGFNLDHPVSPQVHNETTVLPPTVSIQPVVSTEEDDSNNYFEKIDWKTRNAAEIEKELHQQLQESESENLIFLVALEPTGLIHSIEKFQNQILKLQEWSKTCQIRLSSAHHGVDQFEQLNNRLELQSKNSERVQQILESILQSVDRDEIPFQDWEATLQATGEYPASELDGIISKRKELEQTISKYCIELSHSIMATVRGRSSDPSPSSSSSSSPRFSSLRKLSRATSSTYSIDMHLSLDHSQLHQRVLEKHAQDINLMQRLCRCSWEECLDSYTTFASSIYIRHLKVTFQTLKDNLLPKKPLAKLATAPSWDLTHPIHLETSNGTMLLTRGLNHVIQLCRQEQLFLSDFFSLETIQRVETMEKLFLKCLKRLIDFAEQAYMIDPVQFLSMIAQVDVMIQDSADDIFLCSILVRFQLFLKKKTSLFIDQQEKWLLDTASTVDIKQAGVLLPLKKVQTFLARLIDQQQEEEQVSSSSFLHRMIKSVFVWVEKVALTNSKYQNVMKMENYYFLSKSFAMFHQDAYSDQAKELYLENERKYVGWLFESRFCLLTKHFETIQTLLQDTNIPMTEIQYHCPKSTTFDLVEADLKLHLNSHVAAIAKRMQKHLSKELNLAATTCWNSLESLMVETYSTYGIVAFQAYKCELSVTVTDFAATVRLNGTRSFGIEY